MNAAKISVIIPLYNSEKYIRECLISVLTSKFQDYEVLVVDDCSTDNSLAEVKKFLPHFNGRLKIFSTEKNSGGAGIPRNIGIKNSSGKYVTFIDNDDMILPTTLENFFEVAEFYGADVVYAEKFFVSKAGEKVSGKNLKTVFLRTIEELVDVPTPESDNLVERILRDMAGKFFITPWGKLYRRDFLTENEIYFPQMRFAEDVTFCFKCLCLAKKFIRIPHVTNIRRELENSAARMIVDSRDGVRFWLDSLTKNISELDDFTVKLGVEPNFRHEILKYYVGVHFGMIKNLFQGVELYEVQKIFYNELENSNLNPTGKNLFAAYLFAEKAANAF